MYIYIINIFNNKQDDTCVVFSIEVILNCIKRVFPHITNVILQNDNVRFYQKSIVSFFIHVRIISTGLFVSRYIHTYTGSSKGIIGGNLATMINIVRANIYMVFNLCAMT